jgi:hypothetical protein
VEDDVHYVEVENEKTESYLMGLFKEFFCFVFMAAFFAFLVLLDLIANVWDWI